MGVVRLIDEDFRSFKAGMLPADISPIGEYHFFEPGYTGIWYEPNKDTSWTRSGSLWTVREQDGVKCLQSECVQTLHHGVTLPMLVSGERALWRGYRLEADVWPLTDMNLCGIAFGYSDSRHFCLFALSEQKRAVLYKKEGEALIELAAAEFEHDCDGYYRLCAELSGDAVRCEIDGRPLLVFSQSGEIAGAAGIVANRPARFSAITLDMDEDVYRGVLARGREKKRAVEKKREAYPQMRLWRALDLGDFGAARSIRYGDIDGDGRMELLFIQNMPCLNNGNECMISCITAMNLDGRVLWQIGEPNPAHAMITADVPVQVYDIDGDGNMEVIYCKDFRLIIADARTGKMLRAMPMPYNIPHEKYTIAQNITFKRILGDSIRICNFSGKARPSDILIKDRYNNLWAYDCDFNLLWQRYVNCGHFPYAYDIDGDGRDELVAGHSLISADGELIWELQGMRCHVDEIVIGRFDPQREDLQLWIASGEDGVLLVSQGGTILNRDPIGHAQRVSVCRFRPDLPGLQLCATTFWRNTGIITYYDCAGNHLYSFETGANGNVISPVNWSGDGRELLLYSASTAYGGLVDGFGDCVVPFPDDGHPSLCCDNLDLALDGREEVLAWDNRRMFIYTQDELPPEEIYRPYKYEHHNYSNYRGEFSFPKPQGYI